MIRSHLSLFACLLGTFGVSTRLVAYPAPREEPLTSDLPDLVITDITATKDYLIVHYRNAGKGVGATGADFLIGIGAGDKSFPGNSLYRFVVPPPGRAMKTGGFTIGLVGLKPGDEAEVTATIDHEGRVKESNSENNTFTKKLTIPR